MGAWIIISRGFCVTRGVPSQRHRFLSMSIMCVQGGLRCENRYGHYHLDCST